MKTFLLLSLVLMCSALSPSSYITDHDRTRLKAVFTQNCVAENDLSSVHYSVLGLELLGETAVPNKEQLCATAAKLSDDSSVENLFAASGIAATLGCPITLGPLATEAVKTSAGEGSTAASIYFATKTLVSVGSKPDKAVAQSLLNAIKKDDSLLSLGLAFHVAALLEGDVSAVFDRVEDALVQADEVDGKMLQFEGGLSVTSILLTGAANLAAKAKKPLPLTAEQTVKFANYLLSRKSVQQPKGALHLLEGVWSMTGAAQYIPVSSSLVSSVSVSTGSPHLLISVTDLKGGSLGEMSVSLDSATSLKDDSVLASNKPFSNSGANYQLDLMALGPQAGFYELQVSAVPAKANSKLVGNTAVKLSVKVLVQQAVANAELKVIDGDQSTSVRSFQLAFPSTQQKKVNVDHKEKILLAFNVVDPAGAKMLVHQAFVRLSNSASGAEIVYVAEADTSKLYKFELDLGAENLEIHESGEYSMSLILGDAVVSNPVSWHLLDLTLSLPEADAKKAEGLYLPKPEIKHLFREPETRPPQAVSSVFTLLCLAPLLLLLLLWVRLGVNISNFSFSPACIGFHVGLGSIFALYVYFWLELNMFETVRYLALLGVPTFLCGNSLLASIAKKNK